MASSFIGSFLMGQQITALKTALDAANAEITATKSRATTLEAWASDRVKYAYPNGGSEGNEQSLLLDSSYVVNSPFPAGVKFSTYTEYYSSTLSEWIVYERAAYLGGGAGGSGCTSVPRSDISLLSVTTAKDGLFLYSANGGVFENVVHDAATTKWRVRCVRED